MDSTKEPLDGDDSSVGPWGRRAALIKATVNEIRYLARAHRVTKDKRYMRSASDGIDFLLKAQYPSGAWPHSYPQFRNRYDRYATFSDDEMTDLMRLLREIAAELDFEPVGAERRSAAQRAFDKGIDFILRSQVVVEGRPTVWAQQHDEVTYEPRAARVLEPVALSAGESSGILTLLMSIDRPTPSIIRSIESGVAWYNAVKIEGVRIARSADDHVVRLDPDAPAIWARFYQIGTNRPIFAGRDGVVRYRLEEVEKERRSGYTWYDYWGREVLEQYAVWKRLIAKQ